MLSDASQPQYVAPPHLHWGWVFFLSLITLNIFGVIWLIVQANWTKRVRRGGKAFYWAIAYLCLLVFDFILAILLPASTVEWMRLPMAVAWLFAIYTLRSELENEPIGLTLGGIMTFFFSVLYFQYHLQDYPVEALGSASSYTRGQTLGLSGPPTHMS